MFKLNSVRVELMVTCPNNSKMYSSLGCTSGFPVNCLIVLPIRRRLYINIISIINITIVRISSATEKTRSSLVYIYPQILFSKEGNRLCPVEGWIGKRCECAGKHSFTTFSFVFNESHQASNIIYCWLVVHSFGPSFQQCGALKG